MPPRGSIPQQQKGKQSKGGSSAPKPGPTWTAPKSITHPEHHHTLNHLDQVASYYAAVSTSSSKALSSDAACRLQAEMVRSAKTLSRKAVIRMDTGVKRASCATCDTVLIHGLTASVRSRVSGPHDHVIKSRCSVCGTVSRRPAPDLIPALRREGAAQEDQQEADVKKGSDRIPQRQRRRTASIKKQLLRQADSLPAPHAAPLSRKQRSEQRRARIAKRATSCPSTAGPSTTNPALGSQAHPIDVPTSAPPEPPTSPTLASQDDASPQRKRRTPRPQLAHFNDRVHASHWDDVFAKLRPSDDAKDDSTQAYSRQALEYWQKAARSRGDHLVLRGVGKNGALGPQLP